MTLQWISVDPLTGDVIADLPTLEPTFPLRNTLMTTSQATATLHLTGSLPDAWPRAVLPWGAFLAAFDDSSAACPFVWGGIVTKIPQRGLSDALPLNLATFEACLDRVPVGDFRYAAASWARDDILADLITAWFTPDPPGCGIPVTVNHTAGNGPPPASDLIFQNTDNASVKARMDQVCAQLGGEYRTSLAWGADQSSIRFVVDIADRIGTPAVSGLSPAVTFEYPGDMVDFYQSDSYDPGDGAGKVVAYSSGAGDVTNYSTPAYGPNDGRPTWEERFQPANAPLSPAGLDKAAIQRAKVAGAGAKTYTLKISTLRAAKVGRMLGVDWDLGDDIGFYVPASYINEQGSTQHVRGFPDGLNGVGRVLAYDLWEDMVAPIFADNADYSS